MTMERKIKGPSSGLTMTVIDDWKVERTLTRMTDGSWIGSIKFMDGEMAYELPSRVVRGWEKRNGIVEAA